MSPMHGTAYIKEHLKTLEPAHFENSNGVMGLVAYLIFEEHEIYLHFLVIIYDHTIMLGAACV